ncbi:hypothetical protein PIB30_038726 [Stylosanthes scabra]|uniref:Uncharacterized protein n=1 Tax=Stylosanthes scabra TaxID=79078 RepID=A0ABU6SE01_9FABA|nr:hypothetical protein [Stylosanthes scabra]
MGNCQAIDAATLVIQYQSGKIERFYSSVSATHVMKTNPGHYVALIVSTTTLCKTATTTKVTTEKISSSNNNNNINNNNNQIRVTRIKLLKPTDMLLLGHVYRLVTAQEVMKGLRERKHTKKKNVSESAHKLDCVGEKNRLEMEKASRMFDPEVIQGAKPKRHGARTIASSNNNIVGGANVTAKTRFWQPSLQSISEVAS